MHLALNVIICVFNTQRIPGDTLPVKEVKNQQDYYKEATISLYIIQAKFHFLSLHLLLDHEVVGHLQDLISKIHEV